MPAYDREPAPQDAMHVPDDAPPERPEVRALVDALSARHRRSSAEAAAVLPSLAEEIARSRGARAPLLRTLHELIAGLFHELAAHFEREERVLFPYLLALAEAEASSQPPPRPPFVTAARPIHVMHADHEAIRLLVVEIGTILDRVRTDAVDHPRWYELVTRLEAHASELEHTLRVEDHVLFPAALALEARLRG
jgi:regulator of cell morphogenesis and NO signaling